MTNFLKKIFSNIFESVEWDILWLLTFFINTVYMKWSEVAQSCLTLCDPMDCSLLGSSVHGIFQARILEWVAISFSRGTSRPRDWTWVSHIVGRCFTVWAIREALQCIYIEYLIALQTHDPFLWCEGSNCVEIYFY